MAGLRRISIHSQDGDYMKTNVLHDQLSRYKTLLWVVANFSFVFIAVLTNGYYNLFVTKVGLFALIIGLMLALLAWSLAKFIGTSAGGIRENVPLFVLLLLLSAVGVFNSLMINLEGIKNFSRSSG